MYRATQLTLRAVAQWWQGLTLFLLLNLAWVVLQFGIVTGPLATAAVYVLAQRITDDSIHDMRGNWRALRPTLWPALVWGLANLLVYGIVAMNIVFYRSFGTTIAALLMIPWLLAAAAWFTVNLFYWPFFLRQEKLDIRTTLRNGVVLTLRKPGLALGTALMTIGIFAVGAALVVPALLLCMSWVALLGHLVVDEALPEIRAPGRPRDDA